MDINWSWLILTILLLLANLWIIGNDATLIGVLDDPLLLATVPGMIGSGYKTVA